MRPKYYLKLSFRNLFRRKIRNFFNVFALTVAGLLLATLTAFILGVSGFVKAQTGFLGIPEDIILVYPKFESGNFTLAPEQSDKPREIKEEQMPQTNFEPPIITKADIEKIKGVGGVREIESNIYLSGSTKSVRLEGKEKKFEVLPEYNSVLLSERTRIVKGRKLEKGDKGVAVISSKYLSVFNLNNPENLLGKRVILSSEAKKDYKFEIVGVLDKSVAQSPEFLVGYEEAVQIERDDTGNQKLYIEDFGYGVSVIVKDKNKIEQVSKEIEKLGFETTTNKEATKDMNNAIRMVFLILTGIAFTISSLFVFSTMSVAVKDRTREIGIMKAVGAGKGTIRMLFTFESGLLGLIAGAISSTATFAIVIWFNSYSHKTFLKDFPTFNVLDYTWYLPLVVIGITVLFSIIAAFWPAFRASRIDPIKAIRSE